MHKLAFLLNSVSNSAAVPHTSGVQPVWHSEKHFNFQEKPEVCSLYPVALYLGSPRLLPLVPLIVALFYTNSLHKTQKKWPNNLMLCQNKCQAGAVASVKLCISGDSTHPFLYRET